MTEWSCWKTLCRSHVTCKGFFSMTTLSFDKLFLICKAFYCYMRMSLPISSMLYQKTSYLRLSLDAQLENGLSKAANGCFCQQECAKCKSTCKCPLLDYYLYTIILCPFVKVVLPITDAHSRWKNPILTNYIEINTCLPIYFWH